MPIIGSYYSSKRLTIVSEDPLFLTSRSLRQTLTGQIERYSHEIRAIGGYYSASIQIKDRPGKIEDWIDYGLGRHILVFNPALEIIWEGFVNKLTATLGPFQFETGPLLDIGNRIAVIYTQENTTVDPPVTGVQVTTATTNNTDSQARYGIIQKFYSINGSSSTVALQLRDTYANDSKRAYPATSRQTNVSGTNDPTVTIDCLGYWHYLRAFYPTNAATGYVNLSASLQTILAANPNTMYSTDYSQITTNTTQVRASLDGKRTAEDIIKDYVTKGDSSNNAYNCGFYGGRTLYYAPIPTSIEYQQRISSTLGVVNSVNRVVQPWDVQAGRFILFPDFLVGRFPPTTSIGIGTDPRVGFIQVAKFTAPYSASLDGKPYSQLDQILARKGISGT